jgi:hypothetical protein
MLKNIANAICKLTNGPILLVFSFLSLLFDNKKKWNRILAIFFLGLAINAALKCIFKIPLPESLKPNWYAFPSGHMQSNTLYFGAWALEYTKSWFLLASFLFLLVDAWGMWMMEYHTWFHIAGGFIAGICILVLYRPLCKKISEKDQSYFGFIFGCIATLLLLATNRSYHDQWGAVGGLFGLGLGMVLLENLVIPIQKTNPLLKLFVGIIGFGAIKFSTDYFCGHLVLGTYWLIASFLTVLWASYGIEIVFLLPKTLPLKKK